MMSLSYVLDECCLSGFPDDYHEWMNFLIAMYLLHPEESSYFRAIELISNTLQCRPSKFTHNPLNLKNREEFDSRLISKCNYPPNPSSYKLLSFRIYIHTIGLPSFHTARLVYLLDNKRTSILVGELLACDELTTLLKHIYITTYIIGEA